MNIAAATVVVGGEIVKDLTDLDFSIRVPTIQGEDGGLYARETSITWNTPLLSLPLPETFSITYDCQQEDVKMKVELRECSVKSTGERVYGTAESASVTCL